MKVFADLHHSDLYYSLQLLFEKRLNCELYRPIGLEWWNEGYWHIYPHIDTARQFLATDQALNLPKDIHGDLLPPGARINYNYRYENGIYYVMDPTKDKVNRGITLDKFKSMEFDIIISSIPPHIQPFNRLISLYQPKAKHIFQVGNAWGHISGIKNILASTAPFNVPPDINICFYHQEFDLDVFKYKPIVNNKSVSSYIHYMKRPDVMNLVAQKLPSWDFKSFGAGMEANIMATKDIAKQMHNSGFTWHYKPEGDGFGHIIYNSFAVGRVPIIWKSQYRGKSADELMIDGRTCIDAEKHTIDSLAHILNNIANNPTIHNMMSEAAYNRFKEVVDYDKEEQKVRTFLDQLW